MASSTVTKLEMLDNVDGNNAQKVLDAFYKMATKNPQRSYIGSDVFCVSSVDFHNLRRE